MLKKIIFPIILIFILSVIIIFFPPKPLLVFLAIFLLSLISYFLAKIFCNQKKASLISIFPLIFLLINYYTGFSFLNLFLLIFLIIGLLFLIE
ncbi:MAG: hypothetical protein N2482_03515 [Patescibacteria group bacterium]|nr:hypothetical protein [Patescibacteria group bacterium]